MTDISIERVKYYTRGTAFMSSNNKNRKKTNKESEKKEKRGVKVFSRIIKNFFLTIFPSVLLSVGGILWVTHGTVSKLEQHVADLENSIGKIQDSVDKVRDGVTDVKETNSSLIAKVEALEGNFSEVFTISIKQNDLPIVESSYELENPTWDAEDIIASDLISGEEYSAGFLAGKKLLIPYTNNGQEVVFFGQFNENYHWDKDCIINVYAHDKLILIMDAEYDDGKLVTYQQVLTETLQTGQDVWVVTEREHRADLNYGETWNYDRTEDYKKQFELDQVQMQDVVSAEDFIAKIDTPVDSYYRGNTSNGIYNDNTGEAYLVRYNEDGTVKVLYKGCFSDGKFDDSTGKAWELVFDSSNGINQYFYYKGIFRKGNRADSKKIDYVTREQIDQITEGMEFPCDMEWYDKVEKGIQ